MKSILPDFLINVRRIPPFHIRIWNMYERVRQQLQYILDSDNVGGLDFWAKLSLYPINYVWVSWRRGFIPRHNNITILDIVIYYISLYPISTVPRTNNVVEGWHNASNYSVGCSFPSLTKLFKSLQREHSLQEAKLIKWESGDTMVSSKKLIEREEHIQLFVGNYYNRDKTTYLRGIAYIFAFLLLYYSLHTYFID